MVKMVEEVRSLPDEELDRTLADRLDLPCPVEAEVLDRALVRRGARAALGGGTGRLHRCPVHEPRPAPGGAPRRALGRLDPGRADLGSQSLRLRCYLR